MSWQIDKVEVQANTNKVTMFFVKRDAYGRATKREQKTFSRRHLQQAMNTAVITVPWANLGEHRIRS
jgi:hypothetical protein